MNPQLVTTEPQPETQSASHIHLHGTWLILARLTWILISLIAVVMLITSLVTSMLSTWNFTEEAFCHDVIHLEIKNVCLATYRVVS